MNGFKKTLFISDLHLDATDQESFKLFKDLVNSIDHHVDALYILGDFFEIWIGDDNATPFNNSVINLLKSLNEKEIPVYFMHGNRDFLLGEKFAAQAGIISLPDEIRVTIYDTSVLLMHGDTLCIDDTGYQRARKFMRNSLLQRLFLRFPLSFRNKIANKMRRASKQHTNVTLSYKMDVTQSEVVRVMQKSQTKFLIHGHTHKPAFHQFTLDDNSLTRIVLGAWHHKASVLVWYENGYKELL